MVASGSARRPQSQGGGNKWGQRKEITPSDAAADDLFGFSVAMSGNTLLVGAGKNDAGPRSGSVYVFRRNRGGPDNWGEVKRLVASDASAGGVYRFFLAIDGNTAIVGAPTLEGTRAGAAYVVERNLGWARRVGRTEEVDPQ